MASIVLIMNDPDELAETLSKELKDGVTIRIATNGIHGLSLVQRYQPYIVVIDATLPDIFGYSVASIIKDNPQLEDTVVYLINTPADFPSNTKANQILTKSYSPDMLCYQICFEVQRKIFFLNRPDELLKTIEQQNSMLPVPIFNDRFTAQIVYSPFNVLSGDGASFWQANNRLYGFIFDCVGHDLASYGQVGTLWAMLKKSIKLFSIKSLSSLADVMKDVNEDLIEAFADSCDITPAICFYISFETDKLHYCSAGLPSFLIKETGNKSYSTVTLKSYLLGYEIESTFNENTIDLNNIEEIIFPTDGFTELLRGNEDEPLQSAKHDDVTAIYISLKK